MTSKSQKSDCAQYRTPRFTPVLKLDTSRSQQSYCAQYRTPRFTPVVKLDTSNFDEDSIKMNKLAWTHHFPIMSIRIFLKAQGQLTTLVRGLNFWRKFELIQAFMVVLISYRYEKDQKQQRKNGDTIFLL